MGYLDDYSLKEQSPVDQLKALQSVERDDEITAVLEEKGTISGSVTSVIENGGSEDPEEVHVQFLNFKSEIREDSRSHYAVSITQSEDGKWEQAKLSYSKSDTGRVRITNVDRVKWVWPNYSDLRKRTTLSGEEAKIVSMKTMGLTNQEVAEQWDCDKVTIEAVLADIRREYKEAQRTIDRLESSPVDLDGRRVPAPNIVSDDADRETGWDKKETEE